MGQDVVREENVVGDAQDVTQKLQTEFVTGGKFTMEKYNVF